MPYIYISKVKIINEDSWKIVDRDFLRTSVLVKTQNKSSKRILENIDGVPMPDRLEDGIGRRITMTSAVY